MACSACGGSAWPRTIPPTMAGAQGKEWVGGFTRSTASAAQVCCSPGGSEPAPPRGLTAPRLSAPISRGKQPRGLWWGSGFPFLGEPLPHRPAGFLLQAVKIPQGV